MHIVIMAGGSGTRFWPMSRASRPKQLLALVGDKPMVTATYERVKALAPAERTILVVGREHFSETEKLFEGTGVHILVEPFGRNTAPCIGLAAKFVEHLGSNDPLVILPADHYIARPDVFRRALTQAKFLAAQGGIVTLGIVPTRPETGYGYIETDPRDLGSGEEHIYGVVDFIEKPAQEQARQYLLNGNFFWNAGIFVATPRTLLEAFATHMPRFHGGLEAVAPSFGTPNFVGALEALYKNTENISFDYAIMEKAVPSAYLIPCDCGWSDVGSWYSLHEMRGSEQDVRGNLRQGNGLLIDCNDSLVLSEGRRYVAVVGLKKVLVVDTDDALLVADLERSQDIKKITEHLQQQGPKKLL